MSSGRPSVLEGLSSAHLSLINVQPHSEEDLWSHSSALVKRINITLNISTTAEQNATRHEDPFVDAGKYGLGWLYFCLLLLAFSTMVNVWRLWTDKMRRALHKEVIYQRQQSVRESVKPLPYSLSKAEATETNTPRSSTSTVGLLPLQRRESHASLGSKESTEQADTDSSLSLPFAHKLIALIRFITYRPPPTLHFGFVCIHFVTFNNMLVIGAAAVFLILFCVIPSPYFYSHIQDGSPPLAVRSGMMSIAIIPWVVLLGMKVNTITFLTGIGHERLAVLHRWGGYLCFALSLVHAIPFYVQPVWDSPTALANYYAAGYFWQTPYVYGSGIAALAPLAFLCLHSLPIIRRRAYELFVLLHVPISIIFLALLMWHANNVLASWRYLFATLGIWSSAVLCRIFFLNWAAFWRKSWLCGEAASVTLLPENAVKVTIPTQVRWRAGQFVYLRIPELSVFDNHPFTIAALCDSKLPSACGQNYRDMILVFRPFQGFTRRLLNKAKDNGRDHVYQAFIDGPHGGMQRDLAAFDTVVFVAGGSGITAVISHLLMLVHKMREERAVTKKVFVVWAMKRPEAAGWFREELRICRQFAPENMVHCEFYATEATDECTSGWTCPGDNQRRMSQNRSHTSQRLGAEAVGQCSAGAAFVGVDDKSRDTLDRGESNSDVEKAYWPAVEESEVIRMPLEVHASSLPRPSVNHTCRPKIDIKLTIPEKRKQTSQSAVNQHQKLKGGGLGAFTPHLSSVRVPGVEAGLDASSRNVQMSEVSRDDEKVHVSPFVSDGAHHIQLPPPSSSGAPATMSNIFALASMSDKYLFNNCQTQKEKHQVGESFAHGQSGPGLNRMKGPNRPSDPDRFCDTRRSALEAVHGPDKRGSGRPKVCSPVVPQAGYQWQPAGQATRTMRLTAPMDTVGPCHRAPENYDTTGWNTEYGRPNIPLLLQKYKHEFGKRSAVFVCGPETMRRDVMRETANLQAEVWKTAGKADGRDEIYLRVENYKL